MDYATTIIVAFIGSGVLNIIISNLLNARERKKNKDYKLQTAIRLVMKDRMKFLCEEFIKQGYIYQDELDDLIVMHASYHDDLGGNGYLDVLMNKTTELEIRIRG